MIVKARLMRLLTWDLTSLSNFLYSSPLPADTVANSWVKDLNALLMK